MVASIRLSHVILRYATRSSVLPDFGGWMGWWMDGLVDGWVGGILDDNSNQLFATTSAHRRFPGLATMLVITRFVNDEHFFLSVSNELITQTTKLLGWKTYYGKRNNLFLLVKTQSRFDHPYTLLFI